MVEYRKVNIKLSDTQLKKLKTVIKDKTGTTLRMSLKTFNGNDLPHELLLTTIPLGITAAASAIDAAIQKKIHGSGSTTLIISNEETNDIMKIIQALEDSNILLKQVIKTSKNETKEQKGGVLSILLGTLGASLLGNLLAGKEIVRAGSRNKKGKGIVRAGSGNKKRKAIVRAGSSRPSSTAL